MEEADGILFTEKMVYEEQTMNVNYPTVLVAGHVRAAHLYNFVFGIIRKNFNIAGLKSLIQVDLMGNTEREQRLKHIKNYRIYAEI